MLSYFFHSILFFLDICMYTLSKFCHFIESIYYILLVLSPVLNTWVTLTSCCQYYDKCLSHVPGRTCVRMSLRYVPRMSGILDHEFSQSNILWHCFTALLKSPSFHIVCVICFSKFCYFDDACQPVFQFYLYLYSSECYGVSTSFHRIVYSEASSSVKYLFTVFILLLHLTLHLGSI